MPFHLKRASQHNLAVPTAYRRHEFVNPPIVGASVGVAANQDWSAGENWLKPARAVALGTR